MLEDSLIVGGGLSGLFAAWLLQRAGIGARVLEARSRFGGRVLTAGSDRGADCDLGPSWFWPGQPLIAGLLSHFGIRHYEQYADGSVLYQQPDGRILRVDDGSPMAGSLRIDGGVNRLVDAIVADLAPGSSCLNHVITGLSVDEDLVTVAGDAPSGRIEMKARQVAVAIPPRLAADLRFVPELPAQTVQLLAATPTWMAGHAKFFALYAEPFWREQGLCGSAISRRGPLAEIHDASPESGRAFALFGFIGLDAAARTGMGRAELIHSATSQMAALFGAEAREPAAVYLQDWSTEAFTAAAADRRAQTRHPQYGLDLRLGDAWERRLEFISTETSFGNGGLIEGALEAGLRFAKRIIEPSPPHHDGTTILHHASMSWDWL